MISAQPQEGDLELTLSPPETGTVSIAFDLDGPTGSAMLNGTLWDKPGHFALGSYGPHRAMPRILGILEEHQVSATFFTPAWVVEQWPALCQRIKDAGHEMAGHGYRHESFYQMPVKDHRTILEKSQRVFRNLLGDKAAGFRAPSGDWDVATPQLLAEAGYTYSSSLRGADSPFMHHDLELVEIPAKSLFDDYTAFAYHRSPNFPVGLDRISHYGDVFDSWTTEMHAASEEKVPSVTIWHPKVIGTPGRAFMLDQFLGKLNASGCFTFSTCNDIAIQYRKAGMT